MSSSSMEDKYLKVIELICKCNNMEYEDILSLLKDKESKYLLFMALKKYNCTDKETLLKILGMKSKRSIGYNFKKAEEKFYINKELRDKYFKMQENMKKII